LRRFVIISIPVRLSLNSLFGISFVVTYRQSLEVDCLLVV